MEDASLLLMTHVRKEHKSGSVRVWLLCFLTAIAVMISANLPQLGLGVSRISSKVFS